MKRRLSILKRIGSLGLAFALVLGGVQFPVKDVDASVQAVANEEWNDVWSLDGDIVYTGEWTRSPNEGSHGIAYSSEGGATASLTFYGSGIKWIGQKDTNFGNSEVYLDGELVDSINTNGAAVWGVEHYVNTELTEGVHTITVKVAGDGVVDVEKFVVDYDASSVIEASEVTIVPDTEIVFPGDEVQMTAYVQPFNATSKAVTFASSDKSIATVDNNGKVTTLKEGKVTITATSGKATGTYELDVKDVYNELAFDNSGNYIDLPTHYDRYYEMGDPNAAPSKHIPGQVTHPDVIYIEEGFGGHQFWMFYTPNVMVTSQFEQPYIVYSDDGIHWEEPTINGESINPISPRCTEMDEADEHNCDTDIVYDAKHDRLLAYWNWTDDNGSRGCAVRMMVSYDGIHWGAPVEGKEAEKEIVQGEFVVAVSDTVNNKYNLLSPTVTYDSFKDVYLMYFNNAGSVGYYNGQRNKVQVLYSKDGINWPETSEALTVNNFLGKDNNGKQLAPWHQDIQYIPELNEYWALSQCFAGNTPDNSVLYMTKSKDGLNWKQVGNQPVLTPHEAPFWNDFQIYRSTFWYDMEKDEINIWYAALQDNTANKMVADSDGNLTIKAGTDDSRVWRIGHAVNDYTEVMKALNQDEFYQDPAVVEARGFMLTADDPTLEVGDTTGTTVRWGIKEGSWGGSPAPNNEVTDMNIKFTSDNEEVAVVDPWGNITAVGEGIAIIHGITKEGCETDILITVGENPQVTPRQTVDEEHPLYISNYYWSDGAPAYMISHCDAGSYPERNYITYDAAGNRTDRDDPLKLWNCVPDELKDNTVVLLIAERSIKDWVIEEGTTDVQAIRNWYKQQVEFCNKHQIPCAVQNLNGETNIYDRITLTFWKELAEENEYLVGFNGAELYNRFSGGDINNGDEHVADLIRMGAALGVSMMWTDTNVFGSHGVLMDWLEEEDSVLGNAMLDNSEYVSLMYKESYGNPSTDALFLGLWLTGYCGNWGVASDWWHWQLDGNGPLFNATGNIGGWGQTLVWPENMYSQDIIRVASMGATSYKSEPQWFSVATNGHRTPSYQYTVMPTLMNICDGTFKIPTKEEVLERTKLVVKGTEDFSAAIYDTSYSQLYPKTGQYGIVPLVPNCVSDAELRALGFETIVDGTRLTENMLKEQYPEAKYEGNAWAENWGNTWYIMNSSEDKDVKQSATVSLTNADLTIEMEPHAYAVAVENENGSAFDLVLSNYRLDKKELWDGTNPAESMQRVYEYIWEMYERMENNEGLDTDLRTTTITIHCEEEPIVTFEEPETDLYDYDVYVRPFVASEVTGEAGEWTVTVKHNGFLEGTVVLDENAIPTPTPTPTPEPTPEPWVNPFEDVEEGKWYYDAVAWGSQNGVVDGLNETTFGTKVNCTRAQIITFIWRAEGEPEAESAEYTFKDVEEGKYYFDAMLWGVENGIITGYDEDTFAPDDQCTRAQMATFIWRLAGEPEAEAKDSPFPDVEEGKWYTTAAIWAAENGVVTGYDDGTFGPNNDVLRSETITMLFRFFVK